MRFIVMHKVDANMEAGGPPNQEIIQAMGTLVQESLKSGVFQNGAGLHRSAQRVRLTYQNGKRTLIKGPYSGQNELVAAVYMIKTTSLDAAIETANRFAVILGDVEFEIGPIVEPWDLGLIPKPEGPRDERFLLLQKGDAKSEAGDEDPAVLGALAKLLKTLSGEGVLLAAERIAPSSRGARSTGGSKGKRTWTDGPFAESKELIAGFSILALPSKKEALEWADRYAAILEGNEVDVRELLDPIVE